MQPESIRHSEQAPTSAERPAHSAEEERTDRAAATRASSALVQMRFGSGAAKPELSADEDAGAADAASVHASAALGIEGPGSELPFAAQIQQSFGHHDISGVQAHQDESATVACQAIGASAYASGSHVAFADAPDLHTAAHEAAHVVQQRAGVQLMGGVGAVGDSFEERADSAADLVVRGESAESLLDSHGGGAARKGARPSQGGAVIQRRGESTVRKGSHGKLVRELQQRLNAKGTEPPLKIDGAFGPLTEVAVEAFQSTHTDSSGAALEPDGIVGPLTWGAINDEHEAPEIKNEQAALGAHIADGMNKNNNDPHLADQGVHYDFNYKRNFPAEWNDDYSNGLADPQYFERIGWMDWRLKPKMSASAGIKAWLRGLTIAECNSAIVAIQTDAVRATLGDAKFDEHFGSTDKNVPEDQRMRVKTGTAETAVEGLNKRNDAASKGDGGSFNKRPAAVGDWCYFYNHPQYLLKHPGGAFQGENSICMGANDKGEQIWSGMGVDNATERQMLQAMVDAYNHPRDEWDDKELDSIRANHGGTLPAEYDLKSGVFPETLGDFGEILAAPEYTIDGTTRKGGFVPTSGIQLDTTKIEALK